MVNRGDAIGWEEWRELPIEQQMAFRIPISVMVNITHLRSRHPVITASEYLRLHGQDPEIESSSGFWPREGYHSHPNVFEANQTKTPSLFIIENHWYDPTAINRVDYIPEAMKMRGNLERQPGPENYDGSAEYWPPLEHTELSSQLAAALPENRVIMNWNAAKNVLISSEQFDEMYLNDDRFVEEVLNAQGWEVLHTFQGMYVPHHFSWFMVTSRPHLQDQEWTLLRPSLVTSKRSFRARQYEASETTIMMWTLTLSCLPEKRICIASP